MPLRTATSKSQLSFSMSLFRMRSMIVPATRAASSPKSLCARLTSTFGRLAYRLDSITWVVDQNRFWRNTPSLPRSPTVPPIDWRLSR